MFCKHDQTRANANYLLKQATYEENGHTNCGFAGGLFFTVARNPQTIGFRAKRVGQKVTIDEANRYRRLVLQHNHM